MFYFFRKPSDILGYNFFSIFEGHLPFFLYLGLETWIGFFTDLLKEEVIINYTTVLVGDEFGDDTGDYGITIQRTNNPVNPTPINFGDLQSSTIQFVGEEDTYTIQAEAGDVIFLNMLDLGEGETDIDPEVKFFAPDGTLLEREEAGIGVSSVPMVKIYLTGLISLGRRKSIHLLVMRETLYF